MAHIETEHIMIPCAQIDAWLMVVNVAERFVVMSGDIVSAAQTGEPYEVLVRQLINLHKQHEDLAQLAEQAKQCIIVAGETPQINDQNTAHKSLFPSLFSVPWKTCTEYDKHE